jgi:hypothetical protein
VVTRPAVAYPIDPTGARRRPIAYRRAVLNPVHLGVGRWSLVAPLTADTALIAKGWRIVFDGGALPGYSGLVDKVRIEVGDDSGARKPPRLLLSGPDDMTVIDERLAYPDPTSVATSQSAAAYDVRSGTASTVVLAYVDRNAASLALSDRQVPGLTTIADPVVGASIAWKARFDPLLSKVVSPICEARGLRAWITSTTSGARTFHVAAVPDVSGPARFSIALGNLLSLKYEMSAPTATYVIGGGRGEEDDRMFRASNNASAASDWRRIETFVDQRAASDTDGGTELQAAVDRKRDESGPTEQVDFVPLDTQRAKFGVDYFVGSKIAAEVGHGTGVKVVAVVREAEITMSRERGKQLVVVRPKVGMVGVTSRLALDAMLQDVIGRLGNLERR